MATLSRIMSKTEALLDLHLRGLDGVTATVTGSARMMWVIFSMVLGSQIYSLTVAAVLVLTVMTVLFRSFTDTLMCIVPSSFAAILNFGFMGMLPSSALSLWA
jgi:predicted RND superfamily exporter protein